MRTQQRRKRIRPGDCRRRVADPALPERSLTGVRPIPRTALTPGAVVRAPVDFRVGEGWKTRPCVVIEADAHDVTVWPISSSVSSRRQAGAVDIVEWEAAGLSRSCVVLRRVTIVERRSIIDVMGRLTADDLVGIGLVAGVPVS